MLVLVLHVTQNKLEYDFISAAPFLLENVVNIRVNIWKKFKNYNEKKIWSCHMITPFCQKKLQTFT